MYEMYVVNKIFYWCDDKCHTQQNFCVVLSTRQTSKLGHLGRGEGLGINPNLGNPIFQG